MPVTPSGVPPPTTSPLAEAAQRIRQLKEKDDGTNSDRIARIQAAETLKEAIDQKRTEIERLLTEADAALTAAASATSTEDRTRHETAAAGYLRQANDLLGRLRTEVTSWLETVRAIA